MDIEDPYVILAKKLDSSVPRLSPAGQKGEIPKGWVEYLRVLIQPEDIQYLIKLNVSPNSMTLTRFARKIKKTEDEALRIIVSPSLSNVAATSLNINIPSETVDNMPNTAINKLMVT